MLVFYKNLRFIARRLHNYPVIIENSLHRKQEFPVIAITFLF